MKKSILIILLSCCMIMFFSVPVSATDYTFKGCGHSSNYDVSVMSKQLVENIIKSECGTLDNIYYLASWKEDFSGRPYSILIWLLFDIEVKGLKGNVAYVLNDGGMRVNRNWGVLYNNNFSEIFVEPGYTSCYVETSSNPFQYGFTDHSQEMYLCTNIPIFKTVEGKDEYFNTGSTADMIGAEPEYDSVVPHPTDVYLTYKVTESCVTDQLLMKDKDNLAQMRDFDVNLYYQLPDEASNCEVKIFYTANTRTYKWKSILKGGVHKLDIVSALTPSCERSYSSGEQLIKKSELVDREKVLNDLKSNASYQSFSRSSTLGQETLITGYTFYLYCQNGNKKGDVISVSVDMSMFKLGDDFQKTPIVAPTDVNKFNGSNSLEDIVNGDVPIEDSYHVGDYESTDVGGNITNNISNLFGLVGEDGLIPMLSKFFSFIPDPIISVMVAVVSAVGAVIVIKFVRG